MPRWNKYLNVLILFMETHIVFDLDWTLSDTQKIHQQIESDFIKTKWIDIDPKTISIKYAWRSPQERIPELLSSNNINFTQQEIEDFVIQKDEKIILLLEKWEIKLITYASEILDYLYKQNYKIWISSWACREFIDKFIKYFNLEKIVTASTSANEVENKKPHPDVFLSSFDKLEKQYWIPEIKYVIWDGRSDMEWWYKSWAKTIRLNYQKKIKQNNIYCNFEIKSLKEIQTIILNN